VLGNNVLWIAPSGTALVIDPQEGKTDITDAAAEKLLGCLSKLGVEEKK
jgi:hypothetical protein